LIAPQSNFCAPKFFRLTPANSANFINFKIPTVRVTYLVTPDFLARNTGNQEHRAAGQNL